MNRNRNILKGVLSFLVATTPALAFAHAGEPHDAKPHNHAAGAHEHVAPHGGEVVDLGDLHAEVVFGADALLVYFFTADMTPLPAPKSGKLTLAIGKKVRKGDLTANLDHLAGPFGTPATGRATAIVQATVGGKAYTVRAQRPEGVVAAEIPHHDHRSLRGGQVGMSGDDHVELLAEKGGVYKVWYTDGGRKPLSKDVRGTLVVTAADGRKETIELTGPGKDGVLSGKGSAMDGVGRTVALDGFANGYPVRYPFDIDGGAK